MPVAIKRIKEKALQIQNAWNEGARDVIEFRNTKKADYDADIAAGQASENRIADLKAQLSMEEDNRDTIYTRVGASNVDVRKGVEGHKDFGDDHPIIGAMGFVRKSERDSGLTRGTKTDGGT
jgi:hypothetical protein